MTDYIDREAVMQKFADHVKRSNNSDFAPMPTWNQAVQIVEDFPAADVREVKRGKWIISKSPSVYHSDRFTCPYCDYDVDCVPTNFCPNCGADMREEQT